MGSHPIIYISVPNLLVCCTIFKAGGKGLGLMLQVHVCIFEGNLYTCTGIHTYSKYMYLYVHFYMYMLTGPNYILHLVHQIFLCVARF